MNRIRQRFILMLFLAFIVTVFAAGTTIALAASDNADVVFMVDKADYNKVTKAVKRAGGKVRIQFKYTNAIAVTMPRDKVRDIQVLPGVKGTYKDEQVHLPEPQQMPRRGYESLPALVEVRADKMKTLGAEEFKTSILGSPENYHPYTNQLTRAFDFWNATGHFGEGVIVGIIDTGVSSAAWGVASRIVGGENFTGDGVGATSPLNGSHGTWVASCVGMNTIVGFSNPAVQNAIKNNCPSCVIPDYFAPGIDGILLVGQAPFASFYALKVFPFNSGSTSRSVIGAALERAIELKEMYDDGAPGGVNIQVVNMSIGGVTLFAGNDPIYAPLVERANDAGIFLAVSSSNTGPSTMSIGAPGDSKNIVTVGATNDAIHERILIDFIFGVGFGQLWRPVNNNVVADFSSRGPNADGRLDPELSAPGVYRFAQGASGTSFSWVSGTSFSAPTVAGAAALLLSADPTLTPNQLRSKLLIGADRHALSGAKPFDTGFGFLDVLGAYNAPDFLNPPDFGRGKSSVEKNLKPYHIKVIDDDDFTRSTGWLVPGERKDFYVETNALDRGMEITVTVTPELAPGAQNPLFGDDMIVALHSAKTSRTEDYRGGTPAFVSGGATFTLGEQDMDFGIMRITLYADWTNVGRVKATVHATKTTMAPGVAKLANGTISEGGFVGYAVPVPAGIPQVDLALVWDKDWGSYPTNDLDLLIFDPNGALVVQDGDFDGDADGISFDSPEKISIATPMAGTWTAFVSGFTVWDGTENWALFGRIPGVFPKAIALDASERPATLPAEFAVAQNYPNPFNPSTDIKYQLPEATHVKIEIFDIRGQRVRTLLDAEKAAGYYSIRWDGTSDTGGRVASGVYFYRVSNDQHVVQKRMMLLK